MTKIRKVAYAIWNMNENLDDNTKELILFVENLTKIKEVNEDYTIPEMIHALEKLEESILIK